MNSQARKQIHGMIGNPMKVVKTQLVNLQSFNITLLDTEDASETDLVAGESPKGQVVEMKEQ